MLKCTIETISLIKNIIKQPFLQYRKQANQAKEEATQEDITAATLGMVLFFVPTLFGMWIGSLFISATLAIITAFIIDILLIPCSGIAWCINNLL